MKNPNWLYILTVVLAVLLLGILSFLFFPTQFLTSVIIGFIPVAIVGISFRWITFRRTANLRKQLQQIIDTLEAFDIDEPRKVVFQTSSYSIFNELHANILELVERIRSNYQANRQFTQNASHELQTPLAIIKGHVELLLNSPNLKEKEIADLGIILQNTNRLAKLNSALILLSKIENNRYADFETVNIQAVVQTMLDNFSDLIDLQEIDIQEDYFNDLEAELSETLAEILFANLLQNAIRYNVEDGFIRIQIKGKVVTISNSGEVLKIAPETLFKRFKRKSSVEESLGLGLSIVKRICELYEIDIKYLHQHGLHQLVLTFP